VTDPPVPDRAALRARRIWTLSADGGSADVEVTASDHAVLGEVLASLGLALGRHVLGLWAGSTRLADDLPLTAP
jgi:S-DNA-T family DNA segregation ATPase FtsK/SpoIIIE